MPDLDARNTQVGAELPVAQLAGMHAPYNPRTISPHDLEALQRSMRFFGVVEPIVVNRRTDRIVGGHQRVRAAVAEGLDALPVVWVDLDEPSEKQLNLALNRISGDWDDEKLREVLLALDAEGADLSLAGFDDAELSRLLQRIEEGERDPDAVPEGDQVEKRCEPGDLWKLGRHRLLCGDSTSADDMERLLDGAKPALCITDPPYGITLDQGWRDRVGINGMGQAQSDYIANDDRANWAEVWGLIPCDVIYHWCAGGVRQIEAAMGILASGYEIRSQIIWNKTIASMRRGAYHGKHEPCWYAVKKGSTARWIGDRKQTTVWDAASPKHIMGGSTEEKFDHPTQKPVELFTRAIVNHEGDVLEPFTGSGTCVIACEQTGRTCYAMELDTHYCDVILARWEEFTGQKAERADA